MQLAEFYLDESEAGADRRWLCVAGWIFSGTDREPLHEEWSGLLCQERLPYFRMGDCAHGNSPFKRFDRAERDVLQRRFFEVLKRHALAGFCATFDMRLAHMCPTALDRAGERFNVTPYTLCCYWAFLMAKHWGDRHKFKGKFAYFFEAGHASQSQATRMMSEVFSNPRLREIFRYAEHGFVSKKESAAVQCADILAWQWGKNTKDRANGKMTPRADLLALLNTIECATVHFDEQVIHGFLAEIARHTQRSAITVKSLDAFYARGLWLVPSYWSGEPPYGALPH